MLQLHYADEQTLDLQKMVEHTQSQLKEIDRLRQLHYCSLNSLERTWVEKTVADVTDAVHGVATLIEATRVDRLTRNGKISFGSRLSWAIRGSRRVEAKRSRLMACHSSLGPVMDLLKRFRPYDNPTDIKPYGNTMDINESTPELDRGRKNMDIASSSSFSFSSLTLPSLPEDGVSELMAWKKSKRRGRSVALRDQDIAELPAPSSKS